jgi:hypothetical protein
MGALLASLYCHLIGFCSVRRAIANLPTITWEASIALPVNQLRIGGCAITQSGMDVILWFMTPSGRGSEAFQRS